LIYELNGGPEYSTQGPGLENYYNEVRQVKVPDGLVCIVDSNPTDKQYEVKFYKQPTGSDFPYGHGTTPFAAWTVSVPGSGVDLLVTNGADKSFSFAYASGTWTLNSGTDSQDIIQETEPQNNEWTVTRIRKENVAGLGWVIRSKVVETYKSTTLWSSGLLIKTAVYPTEDAVPPGESGEHKQW